VSNDVRLGAVDAGFIWDSTVAQHEDELEAVPVAELKGMSSRVTLGVLKTCKSPASALRFARYLSARDKGSPIFKKHGFAPIPDGDLWADGDPVIHMHIGAMLRPAVEETIRAFEKREGLTAGNIRINYNGCGVLVSQMKGGESPDGFFACDANYLDEPLTDDPNGKKVRDLFLDTSEISTNQLVMLVHKGNPKKIRQMGDLTKKGVRIGVGDEHKCAMGALTDETFRQGGIRGKVHIVVRTGTGDLLVNQFTADPGEMDAIVVYKSNAKRVLDKFDSIPIDEKCATAIQPIAAGKDSNHKHLVERLIKKIKSAESKQRFEDNAFSWKAAK
jgi:molybdate transport system substrate-binding protein